MKPEELKLDHLLFLCLKYLCMISCICIKRIMVLASFQGTFSDLNEGMPNAFLYDLDIDSLCGSRRQLFS